MLKSVASLGALLLCLADGKSPVNSEEAKIPDSPACDSTSEASVIMFAHSIKKFTDTCLPNGLPNCEDITCMNMHKTFVKDKCHDLVMKCATDTACAFHSQAVPYSLHIGGMKATCEACTTNPGELIEKFESNTKRAAALCKFDLSNIDEPSVHTECQTTECHIAMKSVHLKCLSAWVRGFSWVPMATDDYEAKIGAYTKASIACDPSEARILFASKAAKDTKVPHQIKPFSTRMEHLDQTVPAFTQVPLELKEQRMESPASGGINRKTSGSGPAGASRDFYMWITFLVGLLVIYI